MENYYTTRNGNNMFYISVANTINEKKHFEKMGVAIWLYIYFLV